MNFDLTPEQTDFARSLERLLAGADTAAAGRSWAAGDHALGLSLWQRLAEQGATALLVPEEHDGMGATPVEMVLALEAIGRHAVPGPWIESAAFLPVALADGGVLSALAAGEVVGTVAAPPETPYAVDAGAATHVYVVDGDTLRTATTEAEHTSVDPTRRPWTVTAGDAVTAGDLARARDLATLAASAQLLGAGEHLLAETVAYVAQRRQFGRQIGSYQAIKHRLADARIALDFVRPLVHGAALGEISPSAAKVAASDAAYLASRTALQCHGAIGYTRELDLSVWILRVRALVTAWGSPAHHRARLLDQLVAERAVDR